MPQAEATLTHRLSEFVSNTRYEDLPESVIRESKRLLLDIVGCALGAVRTESAQIALRYVRDMGGSPRSTVLGLDRRSSPMNAAYSNARLANVLDADDTFPTTTHFGNATVFSALALAEHYGRTGRDLVTAIAVGFEVGARIGNWMGTPFTIRDGRIVGWNEMGGPAATVTWAAVAAAASISKLSTREINHAFGMAGANSPQPTIRKWAESSTQSMYKYADAGWCAQAGVSASLLASLGSTGMLDILDGENGFWRFYGSPSHDDQALISGFGTDWQILNTTYKPWPCCRWNHHPLTAFTKILKQHRIEPHEIERIVVRANPFALTSIFREQQPADALSAEFSHPHAIAMVAYGVSPGPGWYIPEALSSPHICAMRARVSVEPEPRSANIAALMEGGQWRSMPGGVDVFARGGVFSATSDYAHGDPWSDETRMTDQELIHKFKTMASPEQEPDEGASLVIDLVDRSVNALLQADSIDNLESITAPLAELARTSLHASTAAT